MEHINQLTGIGTRRLVNRMGEAAANFIASLTPDQRQKELGLTETHLETLRYTARPKGLAAAAMTVGQQDILAALIGEYINRMPEELAEIESAKLRDRGLDGLHFAWAGSMARRQSHYYRLQGPHFLVEYDNTQNDANHIHSVWRDPEDDFGAQLLAAHYARDHKH